VPRIHSDRLICFRCGEAPYLFIFPGSSVSSAAYRERQAKDSSAGDSLVGHDVDYDSLILLRRHEVV
jgi:hypothetical protein